MNKLLTSLFLFFLLLLIKYSNAQLYNSINNPTLYNSMWLLSLKEKNLKPGVKSVQEKYYDGMYKDSVPYNNFNKMFIFDKSGKLIELIDSTGLINEFEVFHSKIKYKTIYTYNQKGDLIESSDYTKFGQNIGKVTMEYSANKCIEKNSSSGQSIIKNYDYKGNIIEEKTFDDAGKLFCRRNMKYDSKGYKIEEAYSVCLNKEKDIFSYDINGNCTGVVSYSPDGQIRSKKVYKYDKLGNLIEESSFDGDNQLVWSIKVKYSNFDKFGNWLKATYSPSSPNRRIETRVRVITYY